MTKEQALIEILTEIKYAGLEDILRDNKALVGGGCLISLMEGRSVNDIDVFFPCQTWVERAIHDISLLEGYECIYNNATACMFTVNGSLKFNFIKKRFFLTMEDLFDDFDFTCTMIGFDCVTYKLVEGEGFQRAFDEKILIFNHKNNYPLTSLPRVLRYQKRGYTISEEEMKLMGMAVADIEVKTGADFVKHVGGMYAPNEPVGEPAIFQSLRKSMDAYRASHPFN